MTRQVYFICNALDEVTRAGREITTDSPAASKKIFDFCDALCSVGVKATAVSMGRGRAKLRPKVYAAKKSRVGTADIIYAWFVELPILSQIVSMLSLARIMMALPHAKDTAVIYYNRHPAYLLALLVAKGRRFKNILDLEDGEVRPDGNLSMRTFLVRLVFDSFCRDGALLACDALSSMTSVTPTKSYYGIATPKESLRNWQGATIRILFGGTLSSGTGADQFLGAVSLLRNSANEARSRLEFHVTGSGEMLGELEAASSDIRAPGIVVHRRLSFADYNQLLEQMEVGLALKPAEGPLAQSTFPSKVIEYAAAQILVVTTDVSDVRVVLQSFALFLENSKPETLAATLLSIAERPDAARQLSLEGKERMLSLFSKLSCGRMLAGFIFPQSNVE